MHINFRDMTLELNNTMKKPSLGSEEDDPRDGYLIDTMMKDHVDDSMKSKIEEFYEQHAAPKNRDPPKLPIT